MQGLLHCSPTHKWKLGVFAGIPASGVMLANTSSLGHLLKFESRLSWFACSPPRVARVIARAKTNLSSVHGN